MRLVQSWNNLTMPMASSHTFLPEPSPTKPTIGTTTPYNQGQKKLLLPHLSISWRFAGTIQVQQVIWACSYTNIFSATRELHKNVQRDSRVQPRDRMYLPTHHSTSRRIAGPIKATPMSWLPYIVTYVTPPSTDGHVSLSLFY